MSRNIGGAVWTPIVDDDNLVIEVATHCQRGHQGGGSVVLLRETVIDEGDDDRQVPPLIVGWQND